MARLRERIPRVPMEICSIPDLPGMGSAALRAGDFDHRNDIGKVLDGTQIIDAHARTTWFADNVSVVVMP